MTPSEKSSFEAVKNGDMARLMMSLSRGINLNVRNESQKTLVMEACDHEEDRHSFVQHLLSCGASSRGACNEGRTSLHMICEKSIINGRTLDLLLDYDIPLNSADSKGATALHLLSERGWLDGCMKLLDSCAKPDELCNQTDENGRTALLLSVNFPAISCLLLSYGADPRIADKAGDSPMDLISDPMARAMAHLKARQLFETESANSASRFNDGEFDDLMSHSKVYIAKEFLNKNLGTKTALTNASYTP